MMSPHNRLRSVGWAAALTICVALFVALTFRVNAVKSEVRLAERRIVQLEREKSMLETEFQTRANQHQLASWNKVDFGYEAPSAGQFLEGERQLVRFGTPRAPGAPAPIRVASAPDAAQEIGGEQGASRPAVQGQALVAMVSPLSGRPFADEIGKAEAIAVRHAQDIPGRLGMSATRIVLQSGRETGE